MQTVRLEAVPPQAWRNGGGSTRELLAWPTPAEWQVRISVAQIDRDGPFSQYPGVERWFAVVSGDDVMLRFPGETTVVSETGDPLHFDGASAPDCTLLGRGTQDLNLMVRTVTAQGAMRRLLPAESWHSDAHLRAVFAADDSTLVINDSVTVTLGAGTLAWSDDAVGECWRLITPGRHVRAWRMESWSVAA